MCALLTTEAVQLVQHWGCDLRPKLALLPTKARRRDRDDGVGEAQFPG